jgi:hypothetical protein
MIRLKGRSHNPALNTPLVERSRLVKESRDVLRKRCVNELEDNDSCMLGKINNIIRQFGNTVW